MGIARALTGWVASWPLALGGVMVLATLLRGIARNARGAMAQYVLLGVYVVAQAILFVPLLAVTAEQASGAIRSAVLATLGGFGAGVALAFTVRRDVSFLGPLIDWGLGLGLIALLAAVTFGFQLGMYFACAMIGLAGIAVLHDTSRVLHDGVVGGGAPESDHVAASLSLFAATALMFWYALALFAGDVALRG